MDASALLALTQLGQGNVGELANSHPELLAEFLPLNAVQTAATFAGLLARPQLQANCLRLEALVYFAVSYCEGSTAPTKGLVRRSFDSLADGYCGRAEDPSEDLFVALVNTPKGNFRTFEGIREGNAFHLQSILNVVESMPTGGGFGRLRTSVENLLKISDAVAERAHVLANMLGQELPLKRLPADQVSDLSALRKVVKISKKDLDDLQIQRESLADFIFDPDGKDELPAQIFGHTDLERRPFALAGESVYLLLPTAIGSAITRLVIEYVTSTGQADIFEQALAANFAAVFRSTPLLGTRTPVGFQRIEGGRIGALMREVDPGRYLHLVFFADGLAGFAEGGLCGANAAPEALGAAVKSLIDRAAEEAKARPGFVDALTLLVGCGYGRSLCFGLNNDLPANWRLECVSAHDLMTLSWLPDFDCLSLWRILDAREAIAGDDTELFNINGLLNLVACAMENEGHLVPHGQLPDDFIVEGGHRLITINQNSLRNLRHQVVTHWDARRIQDATGRQVAVKKFEKTYFEEDNAAPLYVSVEDLDLSRLRAVYNASNRPWWIEILPPENAERHYVFEHWKMLCTWLRRIAPVLDSAYVGLPVGPMSLRVTFAEIVGVTQGPTTPKNADELGSLIRVAARAGDTEIDIEVCPGFDDGLLQPDNIAERTLVEAFVNGVATVAGEGNNPERRESAIAAICSNSQMRYMHRFEAQTFRDFLRSEIGTKPLLVNQFDHAACLLGLGWRDRPRKLGPVITGVSDCTSYLNKTVEIVMGEICDILRKLDRRSTMTALLLNHEAASCDRDVWRRTAQANLAMHNDRAAALATIVEHDGRLAVCFTLTRILIEAAICECPLEGGRAPSKLDLSRLISRARLVFSLGGDSDAVYWGAMEPWIRVTPLGDIHMKRSFEEEVLQPFARVGGAVQVERAAENYPKLYSRASPPDSVVGLIDDAFLRAWEAEFGIPVDGMRMFITELENIGLTQKKPIISMRNSDLISLLAQVVRVSSERASEILALITLQGRPKWPVAPAGFKNRDWQPWRFRRRLSALRRPFFQVETVADPEIVFAPGLVHDAFVAMIAWFHDGDIHQSETCSAEMESWIGYVNNKHGNEFTKEVETKLHELGWRTEREIQLTDVLARPSEDRFGDLKRFGDIDVLAWRDASPRVLVVECKDVQFRKTPGEVAEQLADFRGEIKPNGKPDLLKRHLNRIDVLTANTSAVAKRLKLSVPIGLEGHLVFRNPVPMRFAWEHMASRVRLSIFAELDRL